VSPDAWHSRSADEALTHFVSAASGLSAADAAARLATDGPNALTEGAHVSAAKIFVGQFTSLLIWILIAAGVVSGVLGEAIDANNATLGRFLKTSFVPFDDGLLLLAVGAIPLVILEVIKRARRQARRE
jgi:magnesium-transporting ATPase (P-type)